MWISHFGVGRTAIGLYYSEQVDGKGLLGIQSVMRIRLIGAI
jgi:hypothetical protein